MTSAARPPPHRSDVFRNEGGFRMADASSTRGLRATARGRWERRTDGDPTGARARHGAREGADFLRLLAAELALPLTRSATTLDREKFVSLGQSRSAQIRRVNARGRAPAEGGGAKQG